MKKLHYLLFVAWMASSSVAANAQTVKLNDLTPFDKIIITGDAAVLDVASSGSKYPSILVEGAKTENVSAQVHAGILSLDLSNVNDAIVHVFNRELKRIQGPARMEITGAEFIGNNGNYLVTKKGARQHDSHCDKRNTPGLRGFAWHGVDFDIDLDLDELEDVNIDVQLDIDEQGWEWDWNWQWEDHREEIREHTHKWREELQDTMEDVRESLKDDLGELKKELKRLD